MRFIDAIKLGAGLYIGWTFTKGVDAGMGKILSDTKFYEKIGEMISHGVNNSEKTPIGFRPSDD